MPTTENRPPGNPDLGLSDRERATWLLAFLRRDVESLRPGEVLDLRADFSRYLRSAFESDDPAWLADLQRDLLVGLAERTDPGFWDPFGPGRCVPAYIYYGLADGNVSVRVPKGDWDTVAYAAAADLLMEWFPQLRRCQYEECRAWFLPRDGRQRYHDPECSRQRRWKEFEPKRRQNRDYAAEHKQRNERKYGPNVKTGSREEGGKR